MQLLIVSVAKWINLHPMPLVSAVFLLLVLRSVVLRWDVLKPFICHPYRERVIGAFTIALGLWVLLNWFVSPTTAGERKDVAATFAQIVGGTILLAGLYFTWRTLSLNRQGQLAERFDKAADHIGAMEASEKKMETRLGGIYSLLNIGGESDDYYWTVLEILTAYVRTNASWDPPENEADEPSPNDEFHGIPVDIQSILSGLVNRTHPGDPAFEPRVINLSKTDLRSGSLDSVKLIGADFRTSCLIRTGFQDATLNKAQFEECRLQRAHFDRAHLEGAHFDSARLQGARFSGAHLDGTDFKGASLHGAELASAHGLTDAQVQAASGDWTTTLPDNVKRPAHWPDKP